MKKIITTLVALFIAVTAYMQTTIPKAQTLFIYNFSRLIEWPTNYRTGDFVIGILGTSEVAGELETYTKGKKVGTQNIQVIRYKTPAEIQQCHILFVPFARTKSLTEVLPLLNGKSTLIITEKAGALDAGAAINFVIMQDRMKYELRSENATKYGIKFSAKLQEMSASASMMY
ncbi:MAG: YfiR family protein [Bacteroidales bacterium]|nr:YfiR family protein [Bacteroidales bacterium]